MQITIESNIAQIAADLGKTAEEIQRGIQAGIVAATNEVALPLDKERLEVIYTQPITEGPSGPLWERTGALRAAEEAIFPQADQGLIQTNESSPAFVYSEPRHDLESRPNHWRDETAEVLNQNPAALLAAFEMAFIQELGLLQ